MEDDVRRQLEQVQRDLAALEHRVALRDAPDRDAITALTAEKLTHASQLATAAQTELALHDQHQRAAGHLNQVEGRAPTLDALGAVERLVVAGWSFVFIALAVLLVFDVTLLVMRNVLLFGLLLALICAAAGWALAVFVRRPRRG